MREMKEELPTNKVDNCRSKEEHSQTMMLLSHAQAEDTNKRHECLQVE